MKKSRFVFPILFILFSVLLPVPAFCADSHDGWKEVKNYSDLTHFSVADNLNIIESGDYYLEIDIDTEYGFLVQSGTVNICLHGHKISVASSKQSFIVRNGATLNITTCGSNEGAVINSNESSLSVAAQVTGDANLNVMDITLQSMHGSGVQVTSGNLSLVNGLIQGAGGDGIIVTSGNIEVRGEVFASKGKGILIDNTNDRPVNIKVSSPGQVSGFSGAIFSTAEGSGKIFLDVLGGMFTGSLSGMSCFKLRAPSEFTISDGDFVGTFPDGMTGKASGGQYTSDSISAYLEKGYRCVKTEDPTYRYKVIPKDTYTVIFKDGLGNILKTDTPIEGDAATAPPDPVRSGYIFDGWDTDYKAITFSEHPVTVNAKWKTSQTVVIDLKKVKSFKVTPKKGKVVLKWKKPSGKFSKYEIQYGKMPNFSDAKTTYTKKSASGATLKKLERKQKYYIRIRTYRKSGKALHVSKWVKKAVTVK